LNQIKKKGNLVTGNKTVLQSWAEHFDGLHELKSQGDGDRNKGETEETERAWIRKKKPWNMEQI
jgi:hypothetical protein